MGKFWKSWETLANCAECWDSFKKVLKECAKRWVNMINYAKEWGSTIW